MDDGNLNGQSSMWSRVPQSKCFCFGFIERSWIGYFEYNVLHVCKKKKKVVYVDYLKCDIYVNVGEFSGFDFSFVEC